MKINYQKKLGHSRKIHPWKIKRIRASILPINRFKLNQNYYQNLTKKFYSIN
ncbi:MAG: hypothetical protein AAF063_20905 [Cyanobacteria bacterium J06643_5]